MGLFDIFTGQPAKDAAAANSALYNQYKTDATQAIRGGLGNATPLFQQAAAGYKPFSDLGGNAATMYGNALGLNGANGTAAARSAFDAGPGYSWLVNQATDAATRAANATGMGASGNTLFNVAGVANDLANQSWNGWLSNLAGATNTGVNAAGGAGTFLSDLGKLNYQSGNDIANIYGNATSGNANSNTQAANAEMQGSANAWNGLMNLGGNIAKALPMMM